MPMLQYLAKFLVAPLVLMLSLAGYNIQTNESVNQYNEQIRDLIDVYAKEALKNQQLGADSTLPAGLATYNVSGTGVSASATSINLASLTIPQTGQELLDADFSSTFYVTLEPGNRSRQEFASCTTVAQGAGTTATLSGCSRGLSPITPFTASTTLQFAHGAGAQVIFSNSPQFYNQFTAKTNDETITGLWDYSSTTPPRYDLVPINHNSGSVVATTSEFASVAYVNATGAGANVSASETVRGEVELATALESASSTILGGTGAGLVLQARYATDTPQNCSTVGCIVVSQIGGKIRQSFLNLTEAFTWSGLHTFSSGYLSTASSTMSATTTIAASSVTNNALVLNTLAYRFPGTRAASSTVLAEDGSGGLSFVPQDYTLLVSTTTAQTMDYASTTWTGTYEGLRFVIHNPNAINTNSSYRLRFNNDASANYGWSQMAAHGGFTDNQAGAATEITLAATGGSTTSPAYIDVWTRNIASTVKTLTWSATAYSTGPAAPGIVMGGGQWNNTSAAITSLQLLTTTATMPAGVTIKVYGTR